MSDSRKDARAQVLEFVRRFLRSQGFPPTYDEIRESVGLSSRSHVSYYLRALEQEGLLEHRPRSPRGLRIVEQEPAGAGANSAPGMRLPGSGEALPHRPGIRR